MAGNTFGEVLRLTSFGESHGAAMGGILEGMPSGVPIDFDFIQLQLDRRRPGQSAITSPRRETDQIEILSGIFDGTTLGTPIGFIIRNIDAKPADYDQLKEAYRPSHADFAWDQKYGFRDYRGGGRASARETISRVAAGAIAMQFLKQQGITIHAWVSAVGDIQMEELKSFDADAIYSNDVRCPSPSYAERMIAYIKMLRDKGDTTGGIISASIQGVKPGIGEPVFDKLHASLGHAMLSINAVKGFEIGSGFKAASMKGTEHNDPFVNHGGKITTSTNFSGGIQGGISNGNDINFKVAFKPVATIMLPQESVDASGDPAIVTGKGRHDPCVVPRAVPIVASMAALVIADQLLRSRLSRL